MRSLGVHTGRLRTGTPEGRLFSSVRRCGDAADALRVVANAMRCRLLVALLAHNEAESIGPTVLELVSVLPEADILVIDDGSDDETARLASQAGAAVVRHPINLGVAAGEASALMYAVRHGYERVVRMDGDGQHDPASVRPMLDAADTGAELVIGSRFLEDSAPAFRSSAIRRAGSALLKRMLRAASGNTFTDPTSGHRLFAGRAIPYFARAVLHDYPEPESLLLATRCGLTVAEVPVQMRPRAAGRSSLTPLRSAYYMVKVCLAMSIELLRSRPT